MIKLETLVNGHQFKGPEWIYTCPECFNQKLHVNVEKSVFVCVSCWITGRLESDYIPIPPPPPILDWPLIKSVYSSILSTASLRPYHKTWAELRGIDTTSMRLFSSDFVIDKLLQTYSKDNLVHCGLLNCDSGTYKSVVMGPSRIVIPYFNAKNECYYLRSRSIGAEKTYYGPSRLPGNRILWGEHLHPTKKVVVTEGEFKAAASNRAGVPCLGLPGMGSNHDYFVEYCLQNQIKEVMTIFDSDLRIGNDGKLKQEGIDFAKGKLTEKLILASIKVRDLVLPVPSGKIDIDTYIQDNSPETYRKLVRTGGEVLNGTKAFKL